MVDGGVGIPARLAQFASAVEPAIAKGDPAGLVAMVASQRSERRSRADRHDEKTRAAGRSWDPPP